MSDEGTIPAPIITAREAAERIVAAGLESLEEYGKHPIEAAKLLPGLVDATRLLHEIEQAEAGDPSK